LKKDLLILHKFSDWECNYLKSELAGDYRFVPEEKIAGAEVVVAQELPSDFLGRARNLKLVQTPGAGVDKLDIEALSDQGILVSNSHSAAPFVAEHGVAMLLDLMKKISAHDRNLRDGHWFRPKSRSQSEHMFSDSLIGKTVGFIGFGHVGRAINALLQGFDIKALAHSRSGKNQGFSEIEKVLSESDAIFVTLPLTSETKSIIGADELASMKPEVYLINVGRPDVIDEDALLDALTRGTIRGVGLDVWQEGSDSARNFSSLDHRVVLSPHRAGTDRAQSPNLSGVVDALRQYAETGQSQTTIEAGAGY
jgi:phosphoglycerate dehydrogenase-like enzyme